MAPAIAEHEHTTYLQELESFAQQRAATDPAFVRELRRQAGERFGELGFPTTKMEEWRFTNVSPIAKTRFQRSQPGVGSVSAADIEPHTFEGGNRLVFVNGWFTPELSVLTDLPEGVVIDNLAHALETGREGLEAHLGRHTSFEEHAFVALNTAFMADGVYLELPRGAVIEEPIHLLFLSTGSENGEAVVSYPRNLIVAGENSQVRIVETYAGAGDGACLSCVVTEIIAKEGAVVDHYKVQKETYDAFHMATHQLYQERASNLYSQAVTTGGALVRNDVNAMLDGEGIECTLNGLYVLNGTQFVDNHMRVDHAKPHCNSYELFKGILDDRSRAVFNGRIYVAEDAQKTDAKQSSRNLLLSPGALVNANPQLEIFADDVKCTHGSTVGQLDEDAIFYLRSRGIGERAARSLLTYAFASDIVNRIRVEPVRRELEEFLFARLPRGEVVRQAV